MSLQADFQMRLAGNKSDSCLERSTYTFEKISNWKDDGLASVSQLLTLAFNHFLAKITVNNAQYDKGVS